MSRRRLPLSAVDGKAVRQAVIVETIVRALGGRQVWGWLNPRLLSRLLSALQRYNLIDLRAEAQRKVFVFRDRPSRRDDVLAFYGDAAVVPPLAFSSTIKDMKAVLHNA